MDIIIDMHSHLGNNLYHNGGVIIEKKGIKKKIIFDALVKSQNRSNRNYFHNFKFAVEYAKKSF